MEEAILKYGLTGIVIAGLAAYVLIIEKRHKEERTEWRSSMIKLFEINEEHQKELHESQQDLQKETNQVVRDTGNIVSAMKAIFEYKQNTSR